MKPHKQARPQVTQWQALAQYRANSLVSGFRFWVADDRSCAGGWDVGCAAEIGAFLFRPGRLAKKLGDVLRPLLRVKHGALATVRATRQEYVDKSRAVTAQGLARVRNGESPEAVAHWAVDSRNALKVEARQRTPALFNRVAEARNVRRYGNSVGPTYDQLSMGGIRSPIEIIIGAGKTSPWVNKLLGVK